MKSAEQSFSRKCSHGALLVNICNFYRLNSFLNLHCGGVTLADLLSLHWGALLLRTMSITHKVLRRKNNVKITTNKQIRFVQASVPSFILVQLFCSRTSSTIGNGHALTCHCPFFLQFMAHSHICKKD
jgi:hypothetical protein